MKPNQILAQWLEIGSEVIEYNIFTISNEKNHLQNRPNNKILNDLVLGINNNKKKKLITTLNCEINVWI